MCDKLVDKHINIIGTTNTITHRHEDNLEAADSGTLGNVFKSNSPCVDKRIATNPLGIRMPDGHIIYSSHTALLPQDTTPIKARHAHIFPDLKNKALLSIGMFCDNRCLAIFDDKKVHIINKKNNKHIMHGTRNNQSSLYMVHLTPKQNENMTEFNIPDRHFAGSLYKSKSKADMCTFLRLFSVASDFLRNFWTSCLVSPGHVERKLFFIADISVDVHGLHSARWRKVHRPAFDFDSYKLPEK